MAGVEGGPGVGGEIRMVLSGGVMRCVRENASDAIGGVDKSRGICAPWRFASLSNRRGRFHIDAELGAGSRGGQN